jgi:hypothetical protein
MTFPGNAGNLGQRLAWIERLHNLGVHVFIFDCRGFGRSEGDPFEEGLYRDARERQPNGERLVLMGESLLPESLRPGCCLR